MSGDGPAGGTPERLHPSFLLTGLAGSLRGMAGGYAFIAYLAATGQLGTALLAAVALLALLAIGLFLYWSRLEYRVGESDIRIDSGVLSRTHRSIPFDRIQDVEISQGPVGRLFGVAQVKLETGGSAGANEEGVLQAIPLERAQQIRSLVRSRRATAAEAPGIAGEEERPPVFAMDLRRVLLAGIFNFSLALFAGLFGLTQTAGEVLGFDPLRRDFWAGLLSSGHPLTRFVLENQPAAAAAGLVLLLLIGLLTGIVRTLLRDFDFRLDRTPVGLRRRRGLLTKSDVTLPAARAQAAIAVTGPIRDSFGWRELRLQSLARDEGGGGDHVLAPLARETEVAVILAALGWRPVEAAADWAAVSRAFLWSFAVALVPLLLLAVVQTVMLPTVGAMALAVLAGLVLARHFEWRRIGYVLDGDRLLIRTGWWRRRLLILPVKRIQSIDLAQSFLSRWFGAASLVFGVAGGGGFAIHRIPALPEETARALREELLSNMP